MNAVRVFGRLLKETVAEWSEDKAPRLGAALAYYTIFSLAPMLIIAILIAGSFFGQGAVQQRVIAQVAELIGQQGAETVERMVDSLRLSRDAGTLTTVIGVVSLLLGALGVFAQLQDAFDTIWEVTPRPGPGLLRMVQTRAIAFGMVLVIAFLLLASLLLNAMWVAASDYLQRQVPYFGLVSALVNLVAPLVLTTVLFAVMFRVLPSVEIAWRDVWPGAILTAVLFNLGRVGIGFYLGRSTIGSAAGAAGSLLIILVWIYLSAQILFFGAEFTQVWVRHFSPQQPVPSEFAIPLSPEARMHQGIPHADDVKAIAEQEAQTVPRRRWSPARLASLVVRRVEVVDDYTGTLVGFAAGLGVGIVVAMTATQRTRGDD